MRTRAPSEPSGRVTGTITPVDVSLWAHAMASTGSEPSPSPGTGASPGSASTTIGLRRNGAALRAGGELGRELAVGQMQRALADQAAGGGVPERGRAAVAQHHLVPVREREQLRDAGADATHELANRLLAMRGADDRRARAGDVLELLGPHPGGAGSEAPIQGLELVRDPEVSRDLGHVAWRGTGLGMGYPRRAGATYSWKSVSIQSICARSSFPTTSTWWPACSARMRLKFS